MSTTTPAAVAAEVSLADQTASEDVVSPIGAVQGTGDDSHSAADKGAPPPAAAGEPATVAADQRELGSESALAPQPTDAAPAPSPSPAAAAAVASSSESPITVNDAFQGDQSETTEAAPAAAAAAAAAPGAPEPASMANLGPTPIVAAPAQPVASAASGATSALRPGEKKPSLYARLSGRTVPALVRKLKYGTARMWTDPHKYLGQVQSTLNKLKKAIAKYPTPAEELSFPGDSNRILVKSIAQLIPTGSVWEQSKGEAGLAIQLAIQILRDLGVTRWDFEASVPENIKEMYPERPRRSLAAGSAEHGGDTAAPAAAGAVAAAAPGPKLSGLALFKKKAGLVMTVQKVVKVFTGLGGISRQELQRKFDVLGVNCPLLYRACQLDSRGKPTVPEPDMVVQLVEELIKAGADAGRYQEAITMRAHRCKWAACEALLRAAAGPDIGKVTDEELAVAKTRADKHAAMRANAARSTRVIEEQQKEDGVAAAATPLAAAVAAGEYLTVDDVPKAAPPQSGAGDGEDDEDDEDDEAALLAEAAAGNDNEASYRKVLAAITEYDDAEEEANDANQTLVSVARSLPRRALETAPAKRELPIVVAASQQKLGAVSILLYSGASGKARALDGRTLLHVVLEAGSDDCNFALAEVLVNAVGLSVRDASKGGRSVFSSLRKKMLAQPLLSAATEFQAVALAADLEASVAPLSAGGGGGGVAGADAVNDNDEGGDEADSDTDSDEEAEVHDEEHHDVNFHDAGYAAQMYAKVVRAIETYDDNETEGHFANEPLVALCREFPAAELSSPPPGAEPLLVVACQTQKLGAASVLLYCGAKYTTRSLDGRSLLHIVASKPPRLNIELANMLCDLSLSLSDPAPGGGSVFEALDAAGIAAELFGVVIDEAPGSFARQLESMTEAKVEADTAADIASSPTLVEVHMLHEDAL